MVNKLEKDVLKYSPLKDQRDYQNLTEGVFDLLVAGLLGIVTYVSAGLSYKYGTISTFLGARDFPDICNLLTIASTIFGIGSGSSGCLTIKKGYEGVRKLTDFFSEK